MSRKHVAVAFLAGVVVMALVQKYTSFDITNHLPGTTKVA